MIPRRVTVSRLLAGALVSEFIWPVRVYYEDTDSGGVVYYANYLKFMERARTEWLRSFGIEQDRLRDRDGVIFAVRSAHAEFLRPGRFNDRLIVVSNIASRGRASLVFEQKVVRNDEVRETLCAAEVKVACIDAATMKPRAIPREIITEIFGDR